MRILAASIAILLFAIGSAHALFSCAEIDNKIKAELSAAKIFEKRAFEAMGNDNETAHDQYMDAHHTFVNQAAKWSTIFLARCSD